MEVLTQHAVREKPCVELRPDCVRRVQGSSWLLITVPHSGFSSRLFKHITKGKVHIPKKERKRGNKTTEEFCQEIAVSINDLRILGIEASVVLGMASRAYVDYNQPLVSNDPSTILGVESASLRSLWQAYHIAIEEEIERLLKLHNKVVVLDLHGFNTEYICLEDYGIYEVLVNTQGITSEDSNTISDFIRRVRTYFNVWVDPLSSEGVPLTGGYTLERYRRPNVEVIEAQLHYSVRKDPLQRLFFEQALREFVSLYHP